MSSFILKIKTENFYTANGVSMQTRKAIHVHEVPRVGEYVNIAGLFPSVVGIEEYINLKVVAVVHPVSAEPYIAVPEVHCDAVVLPRAVFDLIKENPAWKLCESMSI